MVDRMLEELAGKLVAWLEQLVLLLPNLGVALLVLAIAWLAALALSRATGRLLERVSDQPTLVDLMRKLVRFLVVSVGVLVALHVLNLDEAAATFLAGAGIVGLALGFAFQDLTANLISGVAMAFRQPARHGDVVETNGYIGLVEQIDLRSTVLRTLDGKRVILPNRKVYENILVNHTGGHERRVELVVGVSYGDDLAKAESAVRTAVSRIQPRLDRPTDVFFQRFNDSSIDLIVRFWVRFDGQPDLLSAQSSAVFEIKRAFDESGITIPWPIRTLDFGIKGGTPLGSLLAPPKGEGRPG